MNVNVQSRFSDVLNALKYLYLFFSGIYIECFCVLIFFSDLIVMQMTPLMIFMCHVCANLLSAIGLFGLLPQKYQASGLKSYLYYFLLGFFIPIVGNIGLIMVYFFGIHHQKEGRQGDRVWRITGQALMPNKAPQIHSKLKFGAHGMLSRLQKSGDLKAHLSIVLATRFMREENAVPVLNIALKNSQDDVRLLAFSLLEKKSADIYASIERLQKSLTQKGQKAKIHAAIARNHLRLVTLGLIQDEMKDQVLKIAVRHLHEALAEDGDYRNGYFILGQVLLEQGEVDEAEFAFMRALELGFAATGVYPFLAKAAFLRREFFKIPEYLRQIPLEHRRYAPLDMISTYWLTHENLNQQTASC